jgi:hypothetical protein
LVDESLAPGPRDDFNVDRYPRCDRCDHGWHGLGCGKCDCEGSEGEKPAQDERATYFEAERGSRSEQELIHHLVRFGLSEMREPDVEAPVSIRYWTAYWQEMQGGMP